jgi:hypothetical protein
LLWMQLLHCADKAATILAVKRRWVAGSSTPRELAFLQRGYRVLRSSQLQENQ